MSIHFEKIIRNQFAELPGHYLSGISFFNQQIRKKQSSALKIIQAF
jgi:hypothetical protein